MSSLYPSLEDMKVDQAIKVSLNFMSYGNVLANFHFFQIVTDLLNVQMYFF